MGGQQFCTHGLLLDMRVYKKIIHFDRNLGHLKVESGLMWPELIEFLHVEQQEDPTPWAIRQKQTGVDEVTIGGSMAANIHGRGLNYKPFIDDIDSFDLVDAAGEIRHCSREENQGLFSLVIGGYGLFGVVTQVTIKLIPRQKVKRLVEVIAVKNF